MPSVKQARDLIADVSEEQRQAYRWANRSLECICTRPDAKRCMGLVRPRFGQETRTCGCSCHEEAARE